MKLISMREFVLSEGERTSNCSSSEEFNDQTANFKGRVYRYAQFLSRPLTLGMFIPTNELGEPLEEPKPRHYDFKMDEEKFYRDDCIIYEIGKKKVLFEGEWIYDSIFENVDCVYRSDGFIVEISSTIEKLSRADITLTPSAIKQLNI